jgi:methionyl aminopeptidase
MIPLKSTKETKIMQLGGEKLAEVMKQTLAGIKQGMSLKEIDEFIERLIEKKGGKASFKMVKGYRWASCLNVNQSVVLGVPNDYRLKNGDLLSVDMGIFYKGFHTDMARTVLVGNFRLQSAKQIKKFLEAGKRALRKTIQAAKPGRRIGHLSRTIEKEIKKSGYQPIKTLTGHGVGKELHEPPVIPCYLEGKAEETEELKKGMTLAIEVIYAQGKPEIKIRNDGWTIDTVDNKPAALFEDTIMITDQKAVILTKT